MKSWNISLWFYLGFCLNLQTGQFNYMTSFTNSSLFPNFVLFFPEPHGVQNEAFDSGENVFEGFLICLGSRKENVFLLL